MLASWRLAPHLVYTDDNICSFIVCNVCHVVSYMYVYRCVYISIYTYVLICARVKTWSFLVIRPWGGNHPMGVSIPKMDWQPSPRWSRWYLIQPLTLIWLGSYRISHGSSCHFSGTGACCNGCRAAACDQPRDWEKFGRWEMPRRWAQHGHNIAGIISQVNK